MPVTSVPVRISTPRRSSFAAALSREPVAERGEDLRAAVERTTRASRGSIRRKFVRSAVARQLGDLPGDLDARRPAADDHEGEPRAPRRRRVLLELGHLEGAEDPAAQLERVVDRLHARRVAGELVVAEVRLAGAGGDDQAVVGKVPDRAVEQRCTSTVRALEVERR